MKRNGLYFVVIGLMIIISFNIINAATLNVCPSCNYTTIQGAINNASDSDVINVSAGTYNENQILINKSLAVIGAGFDSTIINGGNANINSIGVVRIIANSDVIFSGFSIINPGSDTSNVRVGIYASSNSNFATYNINHNKIIGTNNPNDENDYGFYGYNGNEKIIFQYNEITKTGANAILMELQKGATDVSYNILDEGIYGSTVYFSMTYNEVDVNSLQKVSNNNIRMNTGASSTSDEYYHAGITFVSSYRNDPPGTSLGNGKYSSIEISNNNIFSLDSYRSGITIVNGANESGTGGNIISVKIFNNNITGIAGSLSNTGVILKGLIADASIKNNTIKDIAILFNGAIGKYGNHYPALASINYNSFNNYNKFFWEGNTSLDARNNWWGGCEDPGLKIS
jgi:hypothetical protein